MMSQEEDRFVLEDAQQVETAYLAAWIADGADELEEELAFFVSVLPRDDLRFEATGETAHLFREQAIDSLAQVSTQHRDQYPHLVMAAQGLLKSLRSN